MSTGRINIKVLGGMLDGEVFTMPLDTRGLRLTHTGDPADGVNHVCVRGDDNRVYALHPITGYDKLAEINAAWQAAVKAVVEQIVQGDQTRPEGPNEETT